MLTDPSLRLKGISNKRKPKRHDRRTNLIRAKELSRASRPSRAG